jgi:DNA polymerase-3 subunit epsilon
MRPLAVIDVETTGLNQYRKDRVIEIAIVLVLPGKEILAEVTTLVNPERDVGPTSIHGITASDIINAPRFAEIAGHLIAVLRGSIALVAHNIRFDIPFLESEFRQSGVKMPCYQTFDTMIIAGGGTLSACCAKYGIKRDGRLHTALHDARAVACLLQKIMVQDPDLLSLYESYSPPIWPTFQMPSGSLLPRGSLEHANAVMPSYIQRLTERLSTGSMNALQPEEERDYRALLWHALEDGRLEPHECDSLVDVATHLGLSFERVKAIHLDYLSQLAKAAWADRRISDTEKREIQMVAQLLGFGTLSDEQLQDLLRSTETIAVSDSGATPAEDWTGKAVCFTGECSCSIRGQLISREMAEQIATEKALRVLPSVTKKLDILVVADPNTQSGKAKKARQYGIRIVREAVFWRSLGIEID